MKQKNVSLTKQIKLLEIVKKNYLKNTTADVKKNLSFKQCQNYYISLKYKTLTEKPRF